MLSDRIEGKWIDSFAEAIKRCKIGAGDPVAILSETQSRQLNAQLAELALDRLGARPFHLVIPSPPHEGPLPFRGSGTTDIIRGLKAAVAAMTSSAMVIDCTQESILYSRELKEILDSGARFFRISDEHPEVLERLKPDPSQEAKVKRGMRLLDDAKIMRVTSEAGTDLSIDVVGVEAEGIWGYCDEPGQMTHWPGGMVLCFPKTDTVNGTIVIDSGDLNLTFKRYAESPVTLRFENDHITSIEGEGTDADLFRSYIAGTGDREAYAMSHIGWGMNTQARWDAMTIYDRGDVNGTEQRVSAGNFLFSTGGNWAADRYTQGHFDIPLRGCTISLDNKVVVKDGALAGDLA